jgi:hypothetical protein
MYLHLDLALGLQLVLNGECRPTDDDHKLLGGVWCEIPPFLLLVDIRRDVYGCHDET